jgi:hypothetical protein
MLFLAMTVFSCKEEEEIITPSLETDVTEVTFASKGETKYVTINTNSEFTVNTQAGWCRYETHKSPFNNLTLIVEKNSVTEERTTEVIVSAEGVADIKIRVTQEAGMPANLDGANKTQPYVIEAEDNQEGIGGVQLDWWVQNPGMGFGTHFFIPLNDATATFSLDVIDEGNYDFRFALVSWNGGQISLRIDNVAIGTLVVPKAVSGNDPPFFGDFKNVTLSKGAHVVKVTTIGSIDFDQFIITYNDGAPFLGVNPTQVSAPSSGGETFVTVTFNNVIYSATSQASWITTEKLEGTINNLKLTVAANTGAERQANVVLSAAGVPDVIVTVTQAAPGNNTLTNSAVLTIEATSYNGGNPSNPGMTNQWVTWNPGYGFGNHVHIEVNNDWVSYPVNVVDAGKYNFKFSVLPWATGTLRLSIDDAQVGSVPYTAPGLSAILLDITNVSLSTGAHTIKVHFSTITAFELFTITYSSN